MRVFKTSPSEGYDWIEGFEDSDSGALRQIDGSPRAASWITPRVRRVAENSSKHTDMPWLGSYALFLNARATLAIGPMLHPYGELLDLEPVDDSEPVSIFNVTCIVDALDEERSDIQRFSSGRISRIKRHEFRGEVVEGLHAFRIPQVHPLFVSEDLVATIRRAGLTGTSFTEVWKH